MRQEIKSGLTLPETVAALLAYLEKPKQYVELKSHLGLDEWLLNWYLRKLIRERRIKSTRSSYGDRIYSLTAQGEKLRKQLKVIS